LVPVWFYSSKVQVTGETINAGQLLVQLSKSHGSGSKSCIMYIVYPVRHVSCIYISCQKVIGDGSDPMSFITYVMYHTSYLLYPRMFLNVVELLIEKSSEEDFPSLC